MATLKNLKIKTGIGRRILKELHSYSKEVDRETAKVTLMRESNADAHDLKQQENVLAESKMMIPDVKRRLETALSNLQSAIAEALKDEANVEAEEVKAAQELIAEAEPLLAEPTLENA
eukprot:TRINITY_DN19729_c0_g1_i1.p1 TRINITY_DN19729_c0_g1~~TRINITY_DN19729_c0_g1_i1.p1  ORF type:complete len:118 (+),score=29.68 TRINITY_DN19729_c0_g1_i1:92-445(+)